MEKGKYCDAYDINMKKIINMILYHITCEENFCYFCKEDDERIDALIARLDILESIDNNLRVNLSDDLVCTISCISSNSFENGLKIGLILLKNLLTAEPPEFHMTHKETLSKENEIIKGFSMVCEKLPLREQINLMTKVYQYEEQYRKNNTLTKNEET